MTKNCISCNAVMSNSFTYTKLGGICEICYDQKVREIEHKKFLSVPGCPSCDGNRSIQFTWDENYIPKFNIYKNYIIPIKKIKYGILYQCKICSIHWWFETKTNVMYLITENHYSVFEKWCSKKFSLSNNKLSQLSKIERTPIGICSSRLNHIDFPCSVITKNSNYICSIIRISSLPPLNENPEFVLFSDEIQHIEKSPYALPIEIRRATSQSVETKVSFYPTYIKSQEGKEFVLNGVVNFFDYEGLKGEDMILDNESITRTRVKEPTIIHAKYDEPIIYYFYSDLE